MFVVETDETQGIWGLGRDLVSRPRVIQELWIQDPIGRPTSRDRSTTDPRPPFLVPSPV